VRVDPGVAVAAAVGLLALGLLLTWGWFESSESSEPADAETRAGAGQQPEVGGVPRIGEGIGARDGDTASLSTRSVGGSLIDDESGPLADGRVDLLCFDGDGVARLGARASVDADGNFVGPACDGRTCARLVHPMFEQPEAWELEPGVMHELVVAPAPRIAGTVVGESGEAIADAQLLLRRGQLRATGRSDVDGTFALALPRERPCDACDSERVEGCRVGDPPTDGSASLLVWAPEFAPHEIEVALGPGAPLRVVLPLPAPAITGRIVGFDGRPITLRTLVLAINRERDAEQHAAEVDADGSFSFADLADAHYRIRAIRDGQELAVLDSAAPGDRVELRVERALHGRDLHVEVHDADDLPTPGARVDGGPFRGAKTDEFGRVEAREVLPGRYTLSVRVAGCPVMRASAEVGPEANSPVHELIRLPADCF
jgi:hypothetical protein